MRLSLLATSAKELWQAVDATLCRDRSANVNSTRTANDLADFFESKVASIRTATDGAPPPTFTDPQSQSSLRVQAFMSGRRRQAVLPRPSNPVSILRQHGY